MTNDTDLCPKCNSPLSDITTTPTGRRLQRCSKGSWNPTTHKNEGCEYVKWLEVEPQTLDEKCPKCGSPLVLQVTRFGKKMKKCSTGSWDKVKKVALGCDYIEWVNGTTEALDEKCPKCGQNLVLFTTTNGKRMKKCSTSGWDKATKSATGCDFVLWLKGNETASDTGEEYLPPEV